MYKVGPPATTSDQCCIPIVPLLLGGGLAQALYPELQVELDPVMLLIRVGM